jgi:hypothetical protein
MHRLKQTVTHNTLLKTAKHLFDEKAAQCDLFYFRITATGLGLIATPPLPLTGSIAEKARGQ